MLTAPSQTSLVSGAPAQGPSSVVRESLNVLMRAMEPGLKTLAQTMPGFMVKGGLEQAQ